MVGISMPSRSSTDGLRVLRLDSTVPLPLRLYPRPKRLKDKNHRPRGCRWSGVGVAARSARCGAFRVSADCWPRPAHWRWPVAIPIVRPSRPRSRAVRPLPSNSLDGLPPGQFQKLVRDLNDEAQARRLAVISREQPSAYRVRGYLAVKVAKHQTTVSWVWDVFDQEEQRALRISGEETAKGPAPRRLGGRRRRHAAPDRPHQHGATCCLPDLARGRARYRAVGGRGPSGAGRAHESSPEAAGIFRISRPQADPISTDAAEAVDAERPGRCRCRGAARRGAALSERETLTFAASSR